MAKTTAAKPSLIPAILALLVLTLFGYILFTDFESSRTEHNVGPPIEIIDKPLPLAVIKQADTTMQLNDEAVAFVNQLAIIDPEPIIINKSNDQFVALGSTLVVPGAKHQTLSVRNIIQDKQLPDDALFYAHLVTDKDVQGLWGIVQAGLIDKFRQGLHIKGVIPNKDMLQAVIPSDADEQLSSGFSSFLGKILSSKVNSSYIYNFETKKMGKDANSIHPGQQLIMIHFSPNELQHIYQFFSEKRNQDIETFAIPG